MCGILQIKFVNWTWKIKWENIRNKREENVKF